MSFGAKHECARLKDELALVQDQLSKRTTERDGLAKTLQAEWDRIADLKIQLAQKTLAYEQSRKDAVTALSLALNIKDQHTDGKCGCASCEQVTRLFKQWTND